VRGDGSGGVVRLKVGVVVGVGSVQVDGWDRRRMGMMVVRICRR
jgi:hypothetical protein